MPDRKEPFFDRRLTRRAAVLVPLTVVAAVGTIEALVHLPKGTTTYQQAIPPVDLSSVISHFLDARFINDQPDIAECGKKNIGGYLCSAFLGVNPSEALSRSKVVFDLNVQNEVEAITGQIPKPWLSTNPSEGEIHDFLTAFFPKNPSTLRDVSRFIPGGNGIAAAIIDYGDGYQRTADLRRRELERGFLITRIKPSMPSTVPNDQFI